MDITSALQSMDAPASEPQTTSKASTQA